MGWGLIRVEYVWVGNDRMGIVRGLELSGSRFSCFIKTKIILLGKKNSELKIKPFALLNFLKVVNDNFELLY